MILIIIGVATLLLIYISNANKEVSLIVSSLAFYMSDKGNNSFYSNDGNPDYISFVCGLCSTIPDNELKRLC